jgi:hypothetical protein
MGTSSPKDKSLKTLKRALILLPLFFKKSRKLLRKRDLVIIAFFTILGIGGVFAAGTITLTQTDTQGAGYTAVTSCDEAVSINKNVTFDLTLQRYVVSTTSISNVNQTYDVNGRNGCGNMIMEMAFPLNGSVTYASWTIPSSTITDGVFTFGANSSTGITYRAYTTLTPVDAQSFDKAAINLRPSTRAVNNGPVFDLLKDNDFTTAGQDASSSYITFALTLSCGTFTVDTTQPGVSAALNALNAPTGYDATKWSSSGANGATSAAYIGFRGTVANINIVLPWISYAWKSDCTNPLPTFQGAIWNAQPTGVTTPIAWNFTENGHYYQYVPTIVYWCTAYNTITGNTCSSTVTPSELPSNTRTKNACYYQVFGLCGYFATVQTLPENSFITSKVGLAGSWLGGNMRTTRTTSKSFLWIDPVAPEYNQVFSTGTSSGGDGWLQGTTIASPYRVNGTDYLFENFGNNEPNNYQSFPNSCGPGCRGEQALQIVAGGTGYWNDFPEQTDQQLGYIVEFGDSTASGESLLGGGSKTGSIVWHY